MRLKGKKVVLLAENLYQDLELWVPYYRLKEEGAEVTVVGSGSSRTFSGKYGYPIEADKEAKEIDMSHYNGIVIPGGYAPDVMRRYPEMVRIVREAHQKGKVIAAICHAGWMLVSAGILKGRKVTGFFAIKDDLVPIFINTLTYLCLITATYYGMMITKEVIHAKEKPI